MLVFHIEGPLGRGVLTKDINFPHVHNFPHQSLPVSDYSASPPLTSPILSFSLTFFFLFFSSLFHSPLMFIFVSSPPFPSLLFHVSLSSFVLFLFIPSPLPSSCFSPLHSYSRFSSSFPSLYFNFFPFLFFYNSSYLLFPHTPLPFHTFHLTLPTCLSLLPPSLPLNHTALPYLIYLPVPLPPSLP